MIIVLPVVEGQSLMPKLNGNFQTNEVTKILVGKATHLSNPNGSMEDRKGSMEDPNGSMKDPNGSMKDPNGSMEEVEMATGLPRNPVGSMEEVATRALVTAGIRVKVPTSKVEQCNDCNPTKSLAFCVNKFL